MKEKPKDIKDFFRRWKQGIKDLSASKQLGAKVIGIYGMLFGVTIGFGFLIARGAWYFIFMGIFIIWLQLVELIGTKQQLRQARKMEAIINGKESIDSTERKI